MVPCLPPDPDEGQCNSDCGRGGVLQDPGCCLLSLQCGQRQDCYTAARTDHPQVHTAAHLQYADDNFMIQFT